jgi:four helix bundle protein
MQRAAISIMSISPRDMNAAEIRNFLNSCTSLKGSCGELRAQLYLALDHGYVTGLKADELNNSLKRLSSMISNFISYLRQSGMKGEKFKGSKS